MRIIGYERVSTARQGASGLGIAAQRQAIDGFAAQRNADLIARFTEVESGRNPDRPELGKALHLAKVTGATLVIAKLDRLSRNAAFLLTLRDSGVRFAAVAIATGGVLTLFIAAAPNAGSVWVRAVDEVSGAVFEQEITTDLPAANQFLAPRLFMNNGATAAAVAFDCSGLYLETDY